MSKYFVINGYSSHTGFWLNADDFRTLYNILEEAFDGDVMKTDLTHMAIVNLVKDIGKQVKDGEYDEMKNSHIKSGAME